MTDLSTKNSADHRVALVRCEDYQAAFDALANGVAMLGGVDKFCQPGDVLLLKPNLLLGDSPERGSTTHPAVFEAAGHLFKSGGAQVFYGDSPGFGSPQDAVKSAGLEAVATRLGITLADFSAITDTPKPDGILIKQFQIAKGLVGVDGVINLPKFKTHGLTRLTGAVKNLFGCLPGAQKAAFHARLPDEIKFAQMLVDLAELIAPRLHIMDGVIGMEGNGPRNGHLRKVGVILLSTNPHALDYCVARLMNLDPELVPTLRVARAVGLLDPELITILGEPIESMVIEDFDANRSKASTTGSQGFYMDIFKQLVTPKPVIEEGKCTRCGRCVSICPVTPKALRFLNGRRQPPECDYHVCIRCYCCQEMCPDEAIHIKTPPLGKLIRDLKI
ncbi:MAG: DUF362 domain-containing protein [Brevefilum sp.]|nr:DUF362 domain-containing protein [Brevefilum sp.]